MKLLLAIVIAGFGWICLPSYAAAPPVNDCKQAFESHLKEQSEGRIRLRTFKKLEGTEEEIDGIKVYTLEYEAEIEFTEDCKWLNGEGGYAPSFYTIKPAAKSKDSSQRYVTRMDNAQHGRIVQAGLRFILAGGIHFIQKEAGWTVETVKIRTYQSALQRNVALRSRWCGQLAGSGSGVQMHPRRLGGAVPGLTFQSAKCLTAYGVQVIQTNLVENSQSSLSLATNLVVGQLFSTLDLTNQLKATFGGTKKKP